MTKSVLVAQLSDQELLAEVKVAAGRERDATACSSNCWRRLTSELERAKCAATDRPRAGRPVVAGSRHIPAEVRREVWKRDGDQCAFVGTHGRCTERGFLEFHHIEPYAIGGAAAVQNLELRCRAHNVHEAEQYFGSRLPLLVREESAAYVS